MWTVKLQPMPPGGPYVVRATVGREAIQINDVMFGDVWLCGGQSNMKYPLRMVRIGNMLPVVFFLLFPCCRGEAGHL